MYLGRAMYINLDSQPIRNAYVNSMLNGMGVPQESILRMSAKYPGESREAMVESAYRDGFEGFKDFRVFESEPLGSIACKWSWCSAFRYIADFKHQDHCCLLMVDDFCLRQPWDRFIGLVRPLDDLRICLFVRWKPVGFTYVEEIPYNDELYRGFAGYAGDAVMVISPAGARLLLEWFDNDPYHYPENLIYKHSKQEVPGCYVVKDRYSWSSQTDVVAAGLIEGNSRVTKIG